MAFLSLSLLAMLAFLSLSRRLLLDYCIFIDESPQQSRLLLT
jgi:hypothetical protein